MSNQSLENNVSDTLSGTLPTLSQIEKIPECDLSFLEELRGQDSLINANLPIDETIQKNIEKLNEKRGKTENQVICSLLDIIDEIGRNEEGFDNAKSELENIRERGIKIEQIVKAFNEVCDKSRKGSDADVNCNPKVRLIYEKIKDELEELNTAYVDSAEHLLEFSDNYENGCNRFEKIIDSKISTIRELREAIRDNTISIQQGEEGNRGNYSDVGVGTKKEEKETLGQQTVSFKHAVVLCSLNSREDVEDVAMVGSYEKDGGGVSITLSDKNYRGIKFKYNGTEYIALVANSYGNAIYFLPFSTYLDLQSQNNSAKGSMNMNGAKRIFWNIKDQEIEGIVDNIRRLPDVDSIGDSLSSKISFILECDDIADVTSKIASVLEGRITDVLTRLEQDNQ